MKRRFLSAAVFALAVCLLTVSAAAASYTVSDSASALKTFSESSGSDFISVERSITISSNFTVNKSVSLTAEGGSITLSGGANVENNGRINEKSLLLSAPSSIVNQGYLELRSIPAGSTVYNYGSMVSPNGLSLNGTLFLQRGSSFSFSKNSVTNASAVISMGLGARLVTESAGRYSVVLPDGDTVYLQGPFDYTVRKTAVPTISLSAPNAQGQRALTITSNDSGAAVYYTIDGSEPTTRSAVYRSAVYVDGDAEIKAVARKTNSMLSDVVSVSASSVSAPAVPPAPVEPAAPEAPSASEPAKSAAPTASPAPGLYTYRQLITLSRPGAKIYYTLDGSTPTERSTLYTGSFDLVSSATVKAIAVENGKAPSEVAAFRYNLTGFNLASAALTDHAQLEKYWQPSVQRIAAATSGSVTVDAGDYRHLSNAVMKALDQKGSVSLTIKRNDASDITIPAGKALTDYQDDVRVWYSLDHLAEIFK